MSTFGTPSQNPGENNEITKRVSEITETIPLTDKQIEEFKDVKLSLSQISRLKEGGLTIIELSKLKIKQLKLSTTNFTNEKLVNQLKTGTEKAQQSTESAEKFIDESMKTLGDSLVGKKTKEAFVVAKEKAKEVGAGFSWKKLENMPFIGGLFKFLGEMFGWLKGMVGFGKKVEKIQEKLSAEEIEKTKEKLQILANNFTETANTNLNKHGVSLTQENKKELENFIKQPENFTEQELENLYKAFSEGKITKLSDISKYLIGGINGETYKKINTLIFDEEQKTIIKNAGISTVQKSIENEFGIKVGELKIEQKQALHKLIRENGVQGDFIKLAEKYESKDFIPFSEIISTGLVAIPHMALFTFELMKIIPAEGIFKYFALSSTNLFELSRAEGGDIQDTLLAKLEESSPEEKNLIFGIIMRKGMFAMNIMDKLAFMLTRTIAESTISGHGNFLTNAKIFGTSNFTEQKVLFERFTKSLGKSADIKTEYIKLRMENLNTTINKASQVAEIMEEIKKNPSKIKIIKAKLTLIQDTNPIAKELLSKSINSISDLNKELGTKISSIKGNLGKIQGGGLKGISDVINKGGFGIDSELNNLLKKQEGSLKVFLKEWERYLGQNGGNLKFWRKFNTISESLRFSHDMKNVEIHVNSLTEGATKLEHLKAMQIESPKLFGSLFGTIATGLVLKAGISTKEDNTPILKHIYEVGKYVIPTIGPIQVLLNETGVQKADTFRNSIKFGSETVAMGILLTMDAAYISETLLTKGFFRNNGAGFFKILKYHGQIVTAPIDFIKAANYERLKFIDYKNAKNGEGLIDFLKAKAKISPKIIQKMFKSKSAWLMLTAVGLLGINYFTESTETKKINKLKENGLLDKDLNPDFDKVSEDINIEDKKFILEYLVWGHIEGIKVEFSGNKITTVYTSDKNIKIIDLLYPEGEYIVPLLESLGINTDNNYFKLKKTT